MRRGEGVIGEGVSLSFIFPPNSWTFSPYSASGKYNVCDLEGCAGSVTGVYCTLNDERELKHGCDGGGGGSKWRRTLK